MTQDILSSLSSDEVNSISDTTESLQVATIIKQKYYDIVSRGGLPEHNQLFQLEPSLSALQPTLMFIPDGIGKVEYIKYFNTNTLGSSDIDNNIHDVNTDIVETSSGGTLIVPGYNYVTMLPIRQFLDLTNQFNPTDSDVGSFIFTDNSNGIPGEFTFYYKNNKTPSYCCVLSNYYVIFDGFDKTQDSTLQASKTECFGQSVPTFSLTDSFIPDLDTQQFPLLLNEAKSLAFYELKQQPHALAEQEKKRQWSTVQKNKNINKRPTYFDEIPNFGRTRGTWNRPWL